VEITVIIPAFNEAPNIPSTMEKAMAALRSQFDRFEILLIDDYSTDTTGKMLDELAAQHPEIRVVHNPRNLGAGESIRIGFREAKYDLVIHDAMDYAFDLKDLSKMTPLLAEADVIVAVRKQRAGYSPYRKLTSVVNLGLLHLLFDLKLRDYNFTQLYRKSVLDSVKVEARSTAFLTPETLIRAHDQGFRIKEVEIEYYPRLEGVATSGSPKVILRSLRDMLRFWWRWRRQKGGRTRT
jgi:glycosyltransferase involved in cell wall biosynthesis